MVYIFWHFLSDYVILWVVPSVDSVPVMKNAFGNRIYYINFG